MRAPSLVYPAPSIVVGLGRFGLAVLERLGEDWQQLELSGAGISLNNLRLLSVQPQEQDAAEECWRRSESRQVGVAEYMGGGDLPSLALDFVLLRTLGLVRYRHGTYQVAIPRDRGPVRASDLLPGQGEPVPKEGGGERLVRRRFFEWQDLDVDPVLAAEALRRKAERHASLHLFISPLIHRIRQGHSPGTLMACILRGRSLAEGRDPSPWKWVRKEVLSPGDEGRPQREALSISRSAIQQHRSRSRQKEDLLRGYAEPPLRPRDQAKKEGEPPQGTRLDDDWEFGEDGLRLPWIFAPRSSDPEAAVDALKLLGEDWETTGWASEMKGEDTEFRPLQVSPFYLGLFDHSAERRAGCADFDEGLQARLRYLGHQLKRGLVRLWVGLGRDRVDELTPVPTQGRHKELDDALAQSLEMLERLLIDPLTGESSAEKENFESTTFADGLKGLPERPTRRLSGIRLEPDGRLQENEVLENRLAALGLADPGAKPEEARPLLREVFFPSPASRENGSAGVQSSWLESEDEGPDAGRELRRVLNRETRALLDFSFLAAYRQRPTRKPPRLSVYVVGDMSEAFTRVKMRAVLRDVHAELLRAFSPVFEVNREGFDRALSVVPILWMPHPADPFSGEDSAVTRREEAVIIDSIHRVRRWVESVLPGARRRISQIFINGRVTDNAALTILDSVQQTRDFLSFQIRNDLSQDDGLRRTAIGPGGDDLFASFACYEVEFPSERAREYLANRLVRQCLQILQQETSNPIPGAVDLPEAVPQDSLVQQPREELGRLTEARAAELADQVRAALPGSASEEDGSPERNVGRCLPQRELLRAFGKDLEDEIWQRVDRLWKQLADRRGRMDDLVEDLRHRVFRQLHSALPKIRQLSDDNLERIGSHGLPAVLSRLRERRQTALEELQDAEEQRRRGEDLCRRHRVPRKDPLSEARERVVKAAEAKPDCGPQWVGLAAWALQLPATGAFLSALLAAKLGILAPVVGGLASAALVGGLLLLNTERHRRKVEKAVEGLAEAVRHLVAGSGEESLERQAPSLRSFFEMRLALTASLACRGYALHAYEQAAVDERLGHRLQQSVDVQAHRMVRRAETLGVRPAPPGSEEEDDLRNLFAEGPAGAMEKLIRPQHLRDYYRYRVRPNAVPVSGFIREAGGFSQWRKAACLADAGRIMSFGRSFFSGVVTKPITELDYFSDAVGHHLRRFVHRNYSNMGFGAKFRGYEGLDPDGVRLVADAALVADQALLAAYRQAVDQAQRGAEEEGRYEPSPRTLDTKVYRVRPNAAYMLSLVQGVRAHSVHNLKRFESFHERPGVGEEVPPPVHRYTGCEQLAEHLFQGDQGSESSSAEVILEQGETSMAGLGAVGDGRGEDHG